MMQRQPFQGLPKLTDRKPTQSATSPFPTNGQPQSYTPIPTAPGVPTPGIPGMPNPPLTQQNASTFTNDGITATAQQSPYAAPDEWYKQEWMKFTPAEQRAMTSWLPHFRTLFFAARMYGDQKVKVVDEVTGQVTEMTGWEAATKIGQEADKTQHQQYLDWRSQRRTGLANQQAQEVPFRVTAA